MKTTYDSGHAKSVPAGWAHTPYDELPFFGGRKIKETSNSEIASLLINAGISGASHTNGRQRNLEIYDAHLDSIRTPAADKAVADFLASKS